MTSLVLVHGGSTTSAYWDLTVPHLRTPHRAVDLPGRGEHPADLHTVTLDDAIRSVAADAAALDDDLVLVAHSSGGLVVPGVVSVLGDRIRHIVLNAASVPPENGTGIDCMHTRHQDSVRAIQAKIEAGERVNSPEQPPPPDRLRKAYGGAELNDHQVEFLRDPVRFVLETYNFYFSAVQWSKAASVPVTYVINVHDRAVPLELQHTMISRLPAPPHIVPLDAGHMPAVTMPEVLAALLDGVATYCRALSNGDS